MFRKQCESLGFGNLKIWVCRGLLVVCMDGSKVDMWRSGDHVKLIINAVVPTYKLPEPIQEPGGYFVPRRRVDGPTHKADMDTWQDTMRQLLKCRVVCKEWHKVSFQITREHMQAFCMYIPRVMYCALHMLVDLKTLKENKTIETERSIT